MVTNVAVDYGWTNVLVQLLTSQWTLQFLVCLIAQISDNDNSKINSFNLQSQNNMPAFSVCPSHLDRQPIKHAPC